MPRSRNGSRNPSRGGSPVRRGASPVRRGASPVRRGASPVRSGGDDDDRSPPPSLPLCKSCGRMQMPSAAAKSDSPPRGRTMTPSASRAASRGGSPQAYVYARSDADNVKIAAAAAAHYQVSINHLTQNIQTVSGHQVLLVVDTVIRPLISFRRVLVVPVPETKVSKATMAVATLGIASGSAAGRQVSNRVLEVVSRGGEVLREVVQAVVNLKAVG